MVLRRFWKQPFPRRGSMSGVFASCPGVWSPPEGALCAAGVIYSEGGEERGKSFRKSLPLGRGVCRSSVRLCQALGPGNAELRHPH